MADFFKGEINDNNKDLLLCDYTSNRLGQLFDDITQGTSSGRIEPWNAKTHRLELMDLNDIEKRIQKYEDEDKQDTSNISDNSAHNYYTSNSDKLNSNLSQIINQLNIMFNLINAEIDVDEQQIQEEILNIVDEDIINKVMDRSRIQDRKLLLEIQKIINNFNSRLAELKVESEGEKDYALQEELKKQNIFYNELHKIPKYLLENENNKPQTGGNTRKYKKNKATIIKRVTRKKRKN
jgi:Rad3-related DNA helicase